MPEETPRIYQSRLGQGGGATGGGAGGGATSGAGFPWVLAAQAGLNLLGGFFSSKAEKGMSREQIAAQERMLERQIQAQLQLEERRKRLPDWAYKRMKDILSQPLQPHGASGKFREILSRLGGSTGQPRVGMTPNRIQSRVL